MILNSDICFTILVQKKKKKKCDIWHMKSDMWHVTCDMWHVTHDTWHVSQSHKNPCSVAALLRGNFGSLVDFAEIFTKIHAVLLQNSLQVLHCFHGKIQKNIFCVVKKFPQKLMHCWKFSQKSSLYGLFPPTNAFMEKFHKKVAFMVNFHKTSHGWRISTTIGFVGKFPQKVALLERIHKTFTKNLLCYKFLQFFFRKLHN